MAVFLTFGFAFQGRADGVGSGQQGRIAGPPSRSGLNRPPGVVPP